jgi:predicted dehydrogenase
MEEVKWGIIGCGDVTEVKSGPPLSLVEHSSLMAVMRRDAAKAKDYAYRHSVPQWYSNADELIKDPSVNAVYVATPPDTHAAYAIRAMEAGLPVYVEKPMALNILECEKMISVSEKLNVPLFVAYYRRSLPGFVKVRNLIEDQEIGKVSHINLSFSKMPSEDEKNGALGWRVNPEISGAGHFFDLGSHQLDLLDFLFGPITKVKSIVKNLGEIYPAEDYIEASFTFKNDLICNGKWDFSGTLAEDSDLIEIIGERGSITFSTFDFVPIQLTNSQGATSFDFPKPEHVQFYLIEQVVAELLGKGKSPSNGITAARTSWVMDEVVKEYYAKK